MSPFEGVNNSANKGRGYHAQIESGVAAHFLFRPMNDDFPGSHQSDYDGRQQKYKEREQIESDVFN
mgnify:CR=1 FL=1